MAKGGLFMTKTDNYQLTQWGPGDPIRRADFNRDNAVLDAALDAMPKVAVGGYQGDGTYGADTPCTLTFDFPPKAVVICEKRYAYSSWSLLLAGAETAAGAWVSSYDYVLHTTWDGNTVSYYSTNNASSQCNSNNTAYLYMALG
jgi:hypothetical protein